MYAKFLSHPSVSSNGWLKGPNGETLNQHITVLSIPVETFNADPNRYMMDAEGTTALTLSAGAFAYSRSRPFW